mgnify:CR=1 FL=1
MPETPSAEFETANQFLTAYLMAKDIRYLRYERYQEYGGRWRTRFFFESTARLGHECDSYEKRSATVNAQDFVDCLYNVKQILRKNRDVQ